MRMIETVFGHIADAFSLAVIGVLIALFRYIASIGAR